MAFNNNILTFILVRPFVNSEPANQKNKETTISTAMAKLNTYAILTCLLLSGIFLHAQKSNVKIPKYNDTYCNFVKKLESGQTDINYTNFRDSYLESKQYSKKKSYYDDLKKKVYTELENKNYKKIIKLTKAMLYLDYTSLFAHKYLQYSYKKMGDTLNSNKYHNIEVGIVKSISESGDGKSCDSGWHVIQIEEEYNLLEAMGVNRLSQALVHGSKNTCDRMDVKTYDGKKISYYFEINKVWEMEMKMFAE